MKNRDKFRELIYDTLREDTTRDYKEPIGICRIMKEKVIPYFNENEICTDCNGTDCSICDLLFTFWLDEEYTEPPEPEVDWSKVPVDTLVRVREHENCKWCLRYFKGVDKSTPEKKYEAWSNGATSKTANDNSIHWKYCELVEDEDE